MATELEQFVEVNKTRLAEVNASNPPLYSAISLALDYLNKNYFGGTNEIKVELPSVAPQITETANTTETLPTIWDNAFCSKNWATKIDYDYLIKALKSNRRSKDMKVEIARAFGEICYLLENTKEYLEAIDYYINNVSVTKYIYRYQFDEKVKEIFDKNGFDEYDVVQFSDLPPSDWTMSLVFPMFEQALKIDPIVDELIEYYNEKIGQPATQQTTLTRGTPLTQPSTSNFQFKVGDEVRIIRRGGVYSTSTNAFKALNFINTTRNEFNGDEGDIAVVEATYQINNPIKGIVKAYKIKMITGKAFNNELLFAEDALSLFQTKPQQPTNFAFDIGDKVSINELSSMLYSFNGLMNKIGLDKSKIDATYKPSLGEMGVIVVKNDDQGFDENIYGVELTNGKQILVKESALVKNKIIEVGDWVEIIDVNLLVGVPINSVGVVEKFDNSGDPYIKWVDIVGEDGYFKLDRFELVRKLSDALFEIGDIIELKEDVGFSDVKKGAKAIVTGLGINQTRIQVKFDWIDTATNKKLVGRNKMSDEWWQGYFELEVSNKTLDKIAEDVVEKMKPKTTTPAEKTTEEVDEKPDDEDFEDLANQLEDLDF
jgi:hypothetical protein